MIVEAMLGLSFIGGSNTTFPGRLTYAEHQAIIHTVANHSFLEQTKAEDGCWGWRSLGENYYKLLSFASLKKNWDGYNAEEISEKTISKTLGLLTKLQYQPSLFPTGSGSIQVERYIDDDTFVEVEISAEGISVYSEGIQGTIEEDSVSLYIPECLNEISDTTDYKEV